MGGLPRKVPAVSLVAAELDGLCQGDSVPLRFAGTLHKEGNRLGREPLLKTTHSLLCRWVAACW